MKLYTDNNLVIANCVVNLATVSKLKNDTLPI